MRARSGLTLGLLVGLVLGAAATWILRPSSGLLLDAALPGRSEGTDFVFTADAPGEVLVRVELPAGCTQETTATLRPLLVVLGPEPSYEPAGTEAAALVVRQDRPELGRVRLERAGAYVLRVEPIPMAMGSERQGGRLRAVVRRP